MKHVIFALTVVSALLFVTPLVTPAHAHVVQATSSVSIADIDLDVDNNPQLRQALETEVNRVIKSTIAFKPTLVTLTDAQVVGKRLYFRILIADEEGEQTLDQLNEAERAVEPSREQPAKARLTL